MAQRKVQGQVVWRQVNGATSKSWGSHEERQRRVDLGQRMSFVVDIKGGEISHLFLLSGSTRLEEISASPPHSTKWPKANFLLFWPWGLHVPYEETRQFHSPWNRAQGQLCLQTSKLFKTLIMVSTHLCTWLSLATFSYCVGHIQHVLKQTFRARLLCLATILQASFLLLAIHLEEHTKQLICRERSWLGCLQAQKPSREHGGCTQGPVDSRVMISFLKFWRPLK